LFVDQIGGDIAQAAVYDISAAARVQPSLARGQETRQMINKFAATLATLAVLGWALPTLAQDEVSDAVDKALWCGAAYSALTQIDGMSEEDIASADANATIAFEAAVIAMNEDGIADTEYDRLIEYYIEIAVENLTNPEAELRYSDAECEALAE